MGQLAEPVSTVLDASGNGTVKLRPSNMRTVWTVQSVAVKVTSNTLEPTATLHLGTVTGADLGSTYTGSNDTCADLRVDLTPGQGIVCRWTGGDPGATATATAYGTTSTWS
jgi:hypothetical protein